LTDFTDEQVFDYTDKLEKENPFKAPEPVNQVHENDFEEWPEILQAHP
jgi:hypothetical protein